MHRLLLPLGVAMALAGCDGRGLPDTEPVTGGRPDRGQVLIGHFGCGSCHRIPGIARAEGQVGPPLEGIRDRVYLGGVVPNSGDTIVQWIVSPRSLSPRTAMPAVGVDAGQARDIAAYLYSR